jgi:hypothetical protein
VLNQIRADGSRGSSSDAAQHATAGLVCGESGGTASDEGGAETALALRALSAGNTAAGVLVVAGLARLAVLALLVLLVLLLVVLALLVLAVLGLLSVGRGAAVVIAWLAAVLLLLLRGVALVVLLLLAVLLL